MIYNKLTPSLSACDSQGCQGRHCSPVYLPCGTIAYHTPSQRQLVLFCIPYINYAQKAKYGLSEALQNASHIVWATGGKLVPEEVRQAFYNTHL